ncbi:MAG: pyridoxal phosphate-dependent aminotransferase [Candidatus Cloacimonetes bacterium]|nr:pyridoxal phosphate-dependent aminotransferase [Candidatus Cloacimonadota bacterium]
MEPADRAKSISKSLLRNFFEQAPPGAVNLGLGEIQFPTPPAICQIAREILDSGYVPYTSNAGLPETRKAVAAYYGNIIPAENTCITVGVEEAIYSTVQTWINPGDEVLIPDPSFVAYEPVVRLAGAIPVHFNLDPDRDFRIDFDSLTAGINADTRMLILSNPSNPLGICLTPEEIDFVANLCSEHDILLLVDEIYLDLIYRQPGSSLLGKTDRTVIVSGLSKSHCMTGWRLGWVASTNSSLIKPLIPVHQYICTCAPYLAQKAAIFALSPAGRQSVADLRSQLYENADYMRSRLLECKSVTRILRNDAAPYLFFSTELDDQEICRKILNRGVILIPGSVFGGNGQGWIRLNYGIDRQLLQQATEIIIDTLNCKI